MTESQVFGRILDRAGRADPYPLYAELRKTPVAALDDGGYVVSTYREIVALLHDPRVSSDRRNLAEHFADREPAPPGRAPAFIVVDPPEHDRLRGLAMRHFGPPGSPDLVTGLRPELTAIVTELIDAIAGDRRADIVEAVAYPFPVTVICRILGVPREDEPRFHAWSTEIVESFGPGDDHVAQRVRRRERAAEALGDYVRGLADARRRDPGRDLLSGLLTDDGPDGGMSMEEVVSTVTLLLVAGHETTVNLIANGMLTLLRHPEVLERMRHEPGLVVGVVEELLRYEPPVHFPATRVALDDITIGDTTIPRGAPIVLALAAGNRDPDHVRAPERFDPCREANEHLGFGGGVHYCFGAPLARLEAQTALAELTRRLRDPRLVADPPPYRPSSALRGPRRLLVDYDGVDP
ncbi:cytochrome P450 [Actinoallomurus iriomotensis]|uniref:Cytochrome P450 n=1 Tax=Actinoallomurus iriomotensis TaxID=478107 RepID=A0A9W6RHH4_9ACTN|nr:cytochrome P450 [Actinoallomurus iriomotensis]GLY76121.1 cytochrome P450 [Actinoallomurus iriomotensis]